MKFGVIIFPGSNCDQDMLDTLELMKKKHPLSYVKLWHKDHDLQNCDFIILPGGFSFGDYLRSGAIARFSPIMQEVIEFAQKGGYVFGICNGFQVLCEAHLLPGTLLHNSSHQFICKNIYLRTVTDDSMLTSKLKVGSVLKIPIAHGEGKYYAPEETLNELINHNQVIFRYCDAEGNITADANPNGSLHSIAGICNRMRNIYGMMPHPERAADTVLGNTDGMKIFESVLNMVTA